MATTYLNGFDVRPAYTTESGVVVFTQGDGTDEFYPNQLQCEAYGYTYNQDTGMCEAFTFTENLGESIRDENNNIQGSDNTVERGTNNTYIMGERNVVKGLSRNNIIVGNSNEISSGINNACVLGNYGIANRSGEVVIGGGGFNGTGKGYAQSSVITLTGTTTDESTTSLFVNGNPNVTTIERSSGTVYTSFEAKVIGVRTGGTAAGSEGDRIFLTTSGIIYETTANESTPVIVSTGTVTGWTANAAFSGSNMLFQVTGAADMDISWSCTLHLYEMKV